MKELRKDVCVDGVLNQERLKNKNVAVLCKQNVVQNVGVIKSLNSLLRHSQTLQLMTIFIIQKNLILYSNFALKPFLTIHLLKKYH